MHGGGERFRTRLMCCGTLALRLSVRSRGTGAYPVCIVVALVWQNQDRLVWFSITAASEAYWSPCSDSTTGLQAVDSVQCVQCVRRNGSLCNHARCWGLIPQCCNLHLSAVQLLLKSSLFSVWTSDLLTSSACDRGPNIRLESELDEMTTFPLRQSVVSVTLMLSLMMPPTLPPTMLFL